MFLPLLSSILPISLLPLALSLPTTPLTTQTWTVTRLDYHFMSAYPGIGPPHTPWPDDKKFKTTLSLEVRIPDAKAAAGAWNLTCSAEWEHGVLPGEQMVCEGEEGGGEDEDEDVVFGVAPYAIPGKDVPPGTPAEMPFTLGVGRKSRLANGLDWFGEVAITCNDHESPTSYLTCMSGPPFDGMRCGLHGIYNIDLGNKKELQVVAESSCPASKTCG